jgi:hypothetical protein
VRAVAPSSQWRETRSRHVLTHNRYRVWTQPASVGSARNLANRPWRRSLLTFVRPNDALEWREHQSAPGTHAFAPRRCRLAVRSVGNDPANAIGASKGVGEPDRVCLDAHGLHRDAPAIGPLESPSKPDLGADRDHGMPHPFPKPFPIPDPASNRLVYNDEGSAGKQSVRCGRAKRHGRPALGGSPRCLCRWPQSGKCRGCGGGAPTGFRRGGPHFPQFPDGA